MFPAMLGAIEITDLTEAVTEATGKAETLIIAGFALTAIFIVARIIKKAANRVG